MISDPLTAQEKYPELSLVPTTYCKSIHIWRFQQRFDYVQDIKRNNSSESFHILYKDGKFGILLHQSGFLYDISSVVLPAKFDYKIDIVESTKNSLTAIVKIDNKYGLFLWEKYVFGCKKHMIRPVYDNIIFEAEKQRYRAERDGMVTFFDMTGHILR